ncbi:MAG: xanthine dehydrogenase family protein molybdopterin-binding subunit, partial [Conexivisphaerales archaeon]
TGTYKYVDDICAPEIYYGGVLRAGIPHGIIKRLDVSGAVKSPGVKAIITAKDVPGLNAFGYFVPEQPVLCYDRVRYDGDAVVAVVADTQEHLARALEMIDLEIEPLPIVDSIDEALDSKAPKIHEKGNIPYFVDYENGNFNSASADRLVDGFYETSMVKPMYIELESTIATYLNNRLEIITTTQSPAHDIQQLSRSLNIDEKNIHIKFMDPGGAFGGKEEIHTQILASLLSMKGKVPVKMTFTREESNMATTRRQAFRFYIKSTLSSDNHILGIYVRAIADAGAYISHGTSVLDVSGSHASGPYFIPNVKFEGMLVYTNHPPAGGMRGYGASEVNFALERHIDHICKELNLDPAEFRYENMLRAGQPNGTGLVPLSTVKARETLEQARSGRLWKSRNKASGLPPYIKIGYGIASGAKSTSYGQGGDSAKVKMTVEDGYINIYFSTPDMGTGIRPSIKLIASKSLNADIDFIRVYNDDTDFPLSGTANASRVTFMIGNAVVKCSISLLQTLRRSLGTAVDLSKKDTLEEINKRLGKVEVTEEYKLPAVAGGSYKKGDFIFSFATAVARVEVNSLTGEHKVTDIEFYPEAGNIINPVAFRSQMEGGIIMSLGYAIMEELKTFKGHVISNNFTTYMVPTVKDVPRITIGTIPGFEQLGPLGAKGAGELPLVAVAPAIVNALADATGKNLTRIPVRNEDLI